MPGLWRAVGLTCLTGLGATALAFVAAVLVAAACHGRPAARLARLALPFLLAVPHLASAVATAFLIAPSGWLARLVSPWLTGWQRPPDLLTVNDPWGLALTLGLALRECPFLLLVLFAAQSRLPAGTMVAVGRTLGYGRGEAWLRLVLPAIYRQIRLPLFAVLAFALSVVDMAIVLGPSAPPVLAVQLLRWFNDPDLGLRPVAAAGAIVQLGLILAGLGLWRLGELALPRVLRPLFRRGPCRVMDAAVIGGGALAGILVAAVGVLAILLLLLWSFAATWRFPAALPSRLSLEVWMWAAGGLAGPAATTAVLGLMAAGLSLALVIACLEHEAATGPRPAARVLPLVYLPLLVPQISFLFGLQILLAYLRLDGTFLGLLWAHLIFVLPYTVLILRETWLALDPRWPEAGRALGSPPLRTFWRIRLPLLRRPVAIAMAVGFTVSVAQYLPTQFVGAGRLPTLATETLGLALGGDRRLAAAAALLLALVPLLALALALAVPSPRLGRDQRQPG